MDTESHAPEVIVKKEPLEPLSPARGDEGATKVDTDNSASGVDQGANSQDYVNSDTDSKSSPHGSLRYVSRRGRPPGGGYSMKPHSHYASFGSSSLMTSQDFGRQSALGHPPSALSPHEIMKNSLGSGLDALDSRRLGLHLFDSEKNSFRCEGCEVVFSSRDTYAMHMLLRAKNESCVALPTSAISANPENPTPREKFEREMREKAMLAALRNQAALMSKTAVAAATAVVAPKNLEALSPLRRTSSSNKEDLGLFGGSDVTPSLSSILGFDAYGLYMDQTQQRQYRRLLSEYGFRSGSSGGSLSSMMEQLSCSVCGELFSSKDALAMHMMFHTRDVENESKPVVSWRDNTNSQTSPGLNLADMEANGRGNEHTGSGRRQENSKTNGDKQLTAERIAELKRMAIESSLRSSLKKQSLNRDKFLQNIRPRSVSEDMVVTSSAQTRPLSADDIAKISNSVGRSIYKPHKSSYKWELDKRENGLDFTRAPIRKRNLSVSDYTTSYDNLSSFAGAFSRRKQFRHDSASLNTFTKDSQYLKSVFGSTGDRNTKVCDNHVSSASGPQDSDETSNGSSSAVEFGQKDNVTNRKAGPEDKTPSLESIMSSDTILVPVDNLEDIEGDDKDARERTSPANPEMKGSDTKAIDFSVSKRDGRCEDDDTNEYRQGHSRTDHLQDRYYNNASSFRFEPTVDDNSDIARQLYVQRHVELITDDESDRQRPLASASHSPLRSAEGNKSAVDIAMDASSRVGEARYCPHCEILFLDVTLFHLHMGLHNVNNPWQCNTCGLVCGGRLEFNTHVLHY